MKKQDPLMASLDRYGRTTSPPTLAVASAAPAHRADKKSSRARAAQAAAHFPDKARARFDVIAAEPRRDVQDSFAEGLGLGVAKHGKPEIAPVRRAR